MGVEHLFRFVELDAAEKWDLDVNSGLFRSEAVKTHKTKKLQEPIVLYAATVEHPAQTQLITKDVVIGHWTGTKFSGALPASRKKALLARANKLLAAVKMAMKEANNTKVSTQSIGEGVFGFLLGTTE